MPSTSSKQARFMAAVAHDKDFAKKAGVPQSVGKDFNDADTGTGILEKKEQKETMPESSKKKRTRMQKLYKNSNTSEPD